MRQRHGKFASALLGVGAVFAAACDGYVPAVDASAPPSARTSAVSLRIDVAPGKPASMTVLAFRASFSGVAASDVLGMVDPLAADAPSRDCQLRDVDHAAAALVARGDVIELEELSGIAVGLGDAVGTEIRPYPRLYPDLTATIGGVVGEAGPFGLTNVPEQIRVRNTLPVAETVAETDPDATTVAIPATGWVRLLNGTVPRDGIVIPASADLNLNLAPSSLPETSIELRPYGATVALSCAVPADSAAVAGQITFMVPRQALAMLMGVTGATPGAPVAAALDFVRRTNRYLPLSATRVSVEVRTSTFVELRP